MSKLLGQWIDLFRAGKHGEKGDFTDQDLDQIVANYNDAAATNFQDPEQHEAPSTIGHPDGPAPAYGWWAKLRRVGSLLQGQMGTVQPEFEEAVERGLFKKRSVGIQETAKGWTLHHVAWLGAQAPKIKGLANVSFQGEKDITEIEFSEEATVAGLTEAETKAVSDSIWERIKAHLPGANKPADPTAKTFSEEDVKRIAGEAVAAAVKPLETRLNEQATTFSERDKALATAETAQRATAAVARVKAGKSWVPAFEKLGLELVFAELSKATDTVEFGEGDAKVKKTPLEILVNFMESLGPIVPGGRKVEGATGAAPIATLPANADPTSIQFSEAIKAEMGKDKTLTYEQAMDRVAFASPALTRTGASTSGQV